jgi:hypothetical protein
MGRFVLSPSVCLRRRRAKSVTTTTPTTAGTPTGDVHYASTHRTTLLTTSGILVLLALVLSTLLPNVRTVCIKIGLRVVPVYTLGLHFKATVPMLFRHTPLSFTARGCGYKRIGLSVAWFATATFAATLWLCEGFLATTLERSEGTLVYMGIAACALLEGGLLTVCGEDPFVASQPSVCRRVQGPVTGTERVLEEGAAETVRKLAGG